MPTANEELRDAFVRHQIFLQQAVGTIDRDVLRILDASEADMLAEIRKQTSRSGDRITKANQARLIRLQKATQAIRGKAWEKAESEWVGEAHKLLGEQQEFLASAFETVAPTVVDVTLVAPQLLRSIVKTHPFEGKTLKQWADTVKKADLARIMDQVRIGMVQGESSEQIARRVVGTVGQRGRNGVTQITRKNAQAITRTMVNDFSNQANQEFFQENKDLIKFELYTATLDARTTPICQSLDGKRFPVGEGAVPPLHFSCRSVRIPVLDPDSLVGVERPFKAFTEKGLLDEFTRNNKLKRVTSRNKLPRGFKGRFDKFARKRGRELTGTAPASLTYQEWLKTQSPDFQDQILGKTKGQLFRQGGLTLDKFVDKRFRPVTISQLRTLNKEAFQKAGLTPVRALEARKLGVGQRATELLTNGLSVDEVLATILKEFPEAKTTKSSIQWYKSQLKKKGILPDTTLPPRVLPPKTTKPLKPLAEAGKFEPTDLTKVINDNLEDRVTTLMLQGHSNEDIFTILDVEFPNLKKVKAVKTFVSTKRNDLGFVTIQSAKNIPGSPLKNLDTVTTPTVRLNKTEATLARNKLINEEVDVVTRNTFGTKEVKLRYKNFQKELDKLPYAVDPRLFQKTGKYQLTEVFASTRELHAGRRVQVEGTFWHTNKIGLRTKSSDNTFIHEYFHHLDFTSLRTGPLSNNRFAGSLFRPDVDSKKADSLRRAMKVEMGKARSKVTKYLEENVDRLGDPILSSEISQGKKIDFSQRWDALFDVPNSAKFDTLRPSNYALHSIEEWIAESGALYFSNRAKLKQVAPETFKAIEDWLSGGIF